MEEDNLAPLIPFEEKNFFCIEYPGYIKNVDRALETMGGEKNISKALSKAEPLQLKFRPKDPFSHPINGDIVQSSKLLLKVTRRVKKGRPLSEATLETRILGQINKTCRFGGLADFQYLVPKTTPSVQLKDAIISGGIDRIMNHRFAEDKIDLNNLQNIPPPLFSVSETPCSYGYRQCGTVVKVRVRQPDGSFKIKLINRNRRKGFDIIYINFAGDVSPDKPKKDITNGEEKYKATAIELRKLFNERYIWSRTALKAFLAPEHHEYIPLVLPSIAYTFRDGPWRFCWILYGIDPRKDSKYAKYQQVDTRKPVSPGTTVQPERNTRLTRGNNPFAVSVNTVNSTSASAKSQVFSAEATEPSTRSALYQLCDIGNEDIKSIINNPAYIKEVPTKRSGYYYDCVAHFLRDAVRRKIEDVKDRNDQESYESLVKSLPEKVEKEKEALLLGHSTEEIANDLGTMSNSFIDRIERGDIYADDSDYEDIEDIEDIEEIEEDEDIEDNGNEDDDDEDDDDDIVRSINKLDKGKRVRLEDLELDELLK